ncbi:MAG TPA: Clp protease N-terminal domain-containing protein [Bryobacteraceae bacterium]|nr:Clp protease N-terminal domain-containing protein [Bryobacteraceae bacterium]
MFERFTERARRTIFFARYEASRLGTPWIDTEQLLLGLLREDHVFAAELPAGAVNALQKRIDELYPQGREKVSTSADLPLTEGAKRTLAIAAEESTALGHLAMDTGHIVLALLRVEKCPAGDLLREHGVEYAAFREQVAAAPPPVPPPDPSAAPAVEKRPVEPAAPSLRPSVQALEELLVTTATHIDRSSAGAEQHLKRKPWTRQQALGHLIDWAEAHHQWLARALTEPRLDARMYPRDEWVAAQHYGEYSWPALIGLWELLNRLLIHVMAQVPEDKANLPCRVGVQDPIPLSELISRYVEHCQDIAGQIVAHL